MTLALHDWAVIKILSSLVINKVHSNAKKNTFVGIMQSAQSAQLPAL